MVKGNVICVFAEYPAPGKVKTRLGEILGMKQAAFLARAFLMDTISSSLRVPRSTLCLAHSPGDSKSDFENLLCLFANEEKDRKIARKATSIDLFPQANGDLGSRMAAASEHLFSNGARKALFVGMDSPLLQPVILRASFELLSKNQMVIGPTFMGGYYLLGCDGHYPRILGGIDSESPGVYKDTVSRIRDMGMRWQELELSYDVEGPEELEQLYFDIENLRLTGEDDIAYHTELCLRNLEK
jgi:rSAM/selenodomain-associated transferase 1